MSADGKRGGTVLSSRFISPRDKAQGARRNAWGYAVGGALRSRLKEEGRLRLEGIEEFRD